MRALSILVLLFFLNFTALPSIAELLDWEIPTTNVVIQEEESHGFSFSIYEKNIPTTLNVHDFIQFFEHPIDTNTHFQTKDAIYRDPHLAIFSPPPEA